MKKIIFNASCFVYIAVWIFMALRTFPKVLLPIKYIVDFDELRYFVFQYIQHRSHYAFVYIYIFCPVFILFMVLFGLQLRKTGKAITTVIMISNIFIAFMVLLPYKSYNYNSNVGAIIFIYEVIVFIFTLSTIIKLKKSKSNIISNIST